jgi:glucose-6-phosphate 1-dehydrogenase
MEASVSGGPPRLANPCCFVIFGASGDLTRRLLLPALYNLKMAGLLPDAFAILGVARSSMPTKAFRQEVKESIQSYTKGRPSPAAVDWLLDRSFYMPGDFADPESYKRLAAVIAEIERDQKTEGNRLFYMATPPDAFTVLARHLGEAGLAREEEGRWRRVIIEKPFGTDVASARALNREMQSVFAESQIYRIDHYLGKETVQNIMALRFANGMFEPLWNRDRIDHVQITVAESLTVESRGKFYDATGALRDMVPNHLFQLISLIAMEPPTCFQPNAVRIEKTKVLEALHRYTPAEALCNTVRGQYGPGMIAGRPVRAYREEPDVAPDSVTETYVALRITIDNWRWAGVPFYLRTGKALAARKTEVAVKFKEAPFAMFRDTPVDHVTQNFIVLRIQPDEGVALQFNAKVPGPQLRLDGVRMDFKYKDYFETAPSTGYETLIYDCMIGDATLFQRAEDVETAWQVVQPILDGWRESSAADLEIYAAGSEGPARADELLARDGRRWRAIAPQSNVE